MQFIRRNINKSLRNGEILASQTSYYNGSNSGSGGGGGTFNGNYLPATSDENGVYIVPHYVTFQETTTTTDTDGNETEVIKKLLEITSSGIRVNGNIIASGEVSAYGSGSTSGGSNVDVDLDNYYTKDEVDDLIDNIDVSGIDLTEYSKTSHTHSNYALTSHTHSGYASTSHTHPISAVTNLQSTLDDKVSNSAFTSHTASTTVHITSTERNKWNSAYTHISDSVTHVTESDKTNWNNKLNKSVWDSVFYIDDSNNLRVKLNLIGEKDVSAYGSGETGNTSIDLENYYTKEEVDDLIANVDIGDIDLSDYSKTSHTHSNYSLTSHTHSGYALTSHTHPISAVTNLQSTLDGKSGTGHTHSNYSPTSHTHSNYSLTSHTHNYLPLGGGTITGSVCVSGGSAQGTFIIRRNPSVIGFQSSSGTLLGFLGFSAGNTPCMYTSGNTVNTLLHSGNSAHTHSNYSLTSHTHNYLPLSNTAAVNVVNSQAGVVNFKSTSNDEVGIRLYLGDTNMGGVWANNNDGIYLYSNNATSDNKLGMDTSGNPYFYSQTKDTKYGLLHRGSLTTSVFSNNALDAMVCYTINAVALSTSNYYPLMFPASAKLLKVRMYSQTGSASAAYNCNMLEFTFNGMGWTDVPASLTVDRYTLYADTEKTIGCIGMGQEGGMKVVWVRGGLNYYVTSNIKPTLYTTNCTNGNEIYTVGTSESGGTNTKVTVYWTPMTTSGKGTKYHNGAFKCASTLAGGSLNISTNATISGTSTFTGAATFNGGLNSTAVTTRGVTFNSANSASLSSSGWYRFATSNAANNYGGTYIFFIRRSYSNTNNESYIIACNTHQGVVTWKQLCGSYSTQLITNVRCTYTNGSTMYFDLQYTGTVANTVYVSCLGTCTIQAPTKTTSTLSATSTLPLAQYAMGDAYAYLRGRVDNPLLYLKHTYNSTDYTYYVQAYQGYLMLGAGSSKSVKIDGSGNLIGIAEMTAHSDKRLKSNIKPLTVRGELNPVTYTKDGKESIGFIAQDVQELYPELVTVDESTDEKYLSLNYQQLTAVLYAEIKELKKEINELKNK